MSEQRPKVVTTLQALADIAGVSRATASRALNDSPLISEKTKRRIRALAAQHRYSVNRRARDFRLQRTSVIAVVFMLDIPSKQHMSDPFFLEILGGIADSLSEHEYDLLLAHAPVSDVLDLPQTRVMQNADGVIFVGQGRQHRELNDLALAQTPMVVWGGDVPDRRYTLVGGDNHAGGYAVADHLIRSGRRRIAFFGNVENPEIRARYAGYRNALEAHGLEADARLQSDVPFEMQQARAAVMKIANMGVAFDAVMCSSDVMALSTIATFRELGINVPDDVAVTGYDDISLAAYSNPPLTTLRQNIRWAGRVLVESVLGSIRGETISDTTIGGELIVRRSCGATG